MILDPCIVWWSDTVLMVSQTCLVPIMEIAARVAAVLAF